MVGNSILNNCTEQDSINEIRLSLSNDREHNTVHLIVEGDDDLRFFKAFVSDNVIVYVSPKGRTPIKNIVSNFNQSQVIGICDKDYIPLPDDEHIFYYDYTCLEIMLLSDVKALKRACVILNPKCAPYSGEEIKQKVLGSIYWLSACRKYNAYNDCGIRFDGIKPNTLLDEENKIEFDALLKDLKQRNPTQDLTFLSLDALKGLCPIQVDGDYRRITQGHDAISVLNEIYIYNCEGKKPREQEIVHSIMSGFQFSETELYRVLRIYENTNNLRILQ